MPALLVESAGALLLEDGDALMAEGERAPGGWLLLEDGDHLLAETGDSMLLESGVRPPLRYVVTLTVGA